MVTVLMTAMVVMVVMVVVVAFLFVLAQIHDSIRIACDVVSTAVLHDEAGAAGLMYLT